MKISDLDLYLVDAAPREVETAERVLLVRVSTASGRQGWGEARTAWRAGELAARRDNLLAVLAGRSAFDIAELSELESLSSAPLRATVEMACWDLVGQAAGQPLCRLLGGEYRRRVPLAIRLPSAAPQAAASLARELTERGFHALVVSASADAEQDLATLSAVRAATADRAKLRFDGQNRYSLAEARELCAALESAGLEFFLDPVAGDAQATAALARQTSLRLAVSRAVRAPADVFALSRGGARPHVAIDLAGVGGLLAARTCAAIGAAAHLPMSLSGGRGVGVALAAMLHLAAATPNLESAHQCDYEQLHADVLVDRLSVVDGMMAVSPAPGLGVKVDLNRLEACQIA